MAEVHIIVCRAKNGAIGYNGSMPWKFPEDLKRFKSLTMGCPVIMGRATWESIGRPLPGRMNIVLTRDAFYKAEGAFVITSLETALDIVSKIQKVFVIGGGNIYKQAMKYADILDVTEIDRDFVGDAFFETPDPKEWKVVSEEKFPVGAHDWAWSYKTYVRK